MAIITAESIQESDRVLNKMTCRGKLLVTIEGEVTDQKIDAYGEPLRTLVSTVAAFQTGKIGFSGASNNPWMLVSYDDEKKALVVRRK